MDKLISVMRCLRLNTPISMGDVCQETRFFGPDKFGPLEENTSLRKLGSYISDVFVFNSLLRMAK